jgi:hypothetical protein
MFKCKFVLEKDTFFVSYMPGKNNTMIWKNENNYMYSKPWKPKLAFVPENVKNFLNSLSVNIPNPWIIIDEFVVMPVFI